MAGICSANNTVGDIPLDTAQQVEINGEVYCDSYHHDNDRTSYEDQNADITITAQEEEVNGYKADKPLTTYKYDTTTGDLYFSHGDSLNRYNN